MKANRLISLLLALLLALPAAALAEGEELTNTDGLVYILGEDGNAEIIGYTGKAEKLEIPAQLDGHPVAVIGNKAFYGNKTLTEVKVPEGVKTMRAEAFSFCYALTALHLPEGLTVLKSDAIHWCDKLKTVNLPDSVTEAGDGLFMGCSALEQVSLAADHPYFSVVDGVLLSRPDHRLIWYPKARKGKTYAIPQGTEIIGAYAFHSSALTKISVPESVTEFHNAAFYRNKKLQKVNIPSKVTELNGAFAGCTALKQVSVAAENPVLESRSGVLFNKVEKKLVFYPAGREGKTYAIPKGTLSIGKEAFSNSKLTGITIPGSVKKIEGNAFFQCEKLKKATVPEGVEELEGCAFQNCFQLTEVSLPRSLTIVGVNPFLRCRKMKTVKLAADHPALAIKNGALISKADQRLIWYPLAAKAKKHTVPKGVRIIDAYAFYGCTQLTEVNIPEGVEEIRQNAFANCSMIRAFTLPASLENINYSAFLESSIGQAMINAVYTVPRGSYAENFCKSYKLKTKVK